MTTMSQERFTFVLGTAINHFGGKAVQALSDAINNQTRGSFIGDPDAPQILDELKEAKSIAEKISQLLHAQPQLSLSKCFQLVTDEDDLNELINSRSAVYPVQNELVGVYHE
ncbi:MAG: hypothetical protein AAF490_02960 [Chloroflexota bacterium]